MKAEWGFIVRRCIVLFLTLVLMTSFVGCSGNMNKKIDKRYNGLKSYTATVNVTVLGNGKPETYVMNQAWQAPNLYRSEVIEPEYMRGTVSIINDDGIWLKGGNSSAVKMEAGTESINTEYMFVSDFFSDYFSEEHLQQLSADEDGNYVLNAAERGTNRHRFTQNLIIDGKKCEPVCLATFDDKGNEALRVEFVKFIPNDNIDKSNFLI